MYVPCFCFLLFVLLDGLVCFGWFMVFNATFNNISVISSQSVLLVEETGVSRENHRPVASLWQTVLLENEVLNFEIKSRIIRIKNLLNPNVWNKVYYVTLFVSIFFNFLPFHHFCQPYSEHLYHLCMLINDVGMLLFFSWQQDSGIWNMG